MYEKTVLTKSPLIALAIFGNKSSPSFFLSRYISLSLPREKYILSKEQAFLSLCSSMGIVETFPDFLIIML